MSDHVSPVSDIAADLEDLWAPLEALGWYHGHSLQAKTEFGTPLLHWVLEKDRTLAWTLVRRLHAADLNVLDDERNTLLMGACRIPGHEGVSLIRWLMARGAPVNHANAQGATALHAACDSLEAGSGLAVVQELLKGGAALNALDASGRTPLILACRSKAKTLPTILALLSAGATPHGKDRLSGRTAAEYAALCHPEALVPLLEAGASARPLMRLFQDVASIDPRSAPIFKSWRSRRRLATVLPSAHSPVRPRM